MKISNNKNVMEEKNGSEIIDLAPCECLEGKTFKESISILKKDLEVISNLKESEKKLIVKQSNCVMKENLKNIYPTIKLNFKVVDINTSFKTEIIHQNKRTKSYINLLLGSMLQHIIFGNEYDFINDVINETLYKLNERCNNGLKHTPLNHRVVLNQLIKVLIENIKALIFILEIKDKTTYNNGFLHRETKKYVKFLINQKISRNIQLWNRFECLEYLNSLKRVILDNTNEKHFNIDMVLMLAIDNEKYFPIDSKDLRLDFLNGCLRLPTFKEETEETEEIKENNNGSSNNYKTVGEYSIVSNMGNFSTITYEETEETNKKEGVKMETTLENTLIQLENIFTIPFKAKDEEFNLTSEMVIEYLEKINNKESKKELLKLVNNQFKKDYNRKNSNLTNIFLKEEETEEIREEREYYNPNGDLINYICTISNILNLDIIYSNNDYLSCLENEIENYILGRVLNGSLKFSLDKGINKNSILTYYLNHMIEEIKGIVETNKEYMKKQKKEETTEEINKNKKEGSNTMKYNENEIIKIGNKEIKWVELPPSCKKLIWEEMEENYKGVFNSKIEEILEFLCNKENKSKIEMGLYGAIDYTYNNVCGNPYLLKAIIWTIQDINKYDKEEIKNLEKETMDSIILMINTRIDKLQRETEEKEETKKEGVNMEGKNKEETTKIENKSTTVEEIKETTIKPIIKENNNNGVDKMEIKEKQLTIEETKENKKESIKTEEKPFNLENLKTFETLITTIKDIPTIKSYLREYYQYLKDNKEEIKKNKDLNFRNIVKSLGKLNLLVTMYEKCIKNGFETTFKENKENYKGKKYTKVYYSFIDKNLRKMWLKTKILEFNNSSYKDKKIIPLNTTIGGKTQLNKGYIIETPTNWKLYSHLNLIFIVDKKTHKFKIPTKTLSYDKRHGLKKFHGVKDNKGNFDMVNKDLLFTTSSSQLVNKFFNYIGVEKPKKSLSNPKYLEEILNKTIPSIEVLNKLPKTNNLTEMVEGGKLDIKEE